MTGGTKNTDRVIWLAANETSYCDSIHVTESGGIGINCGGSVIVKPLREWHRLAASLPDGSGQTKSADGGHCNEQSAQGLSRSPKKISDDYITVEYINAYGGRCRDCADHGGVCPNNGLPCDGRHQAVEHMIAAINYGWANGYLPSTLDNAETRRADSAGSNTPAGFADPTLSLGGKL